MICVPLLAHGKLIGIAEVINHQQGISMRLMNS